MANHQRRGKREAATIGPKYTPKANQSHGATGVALPLSCGR